MNICTSFLRSTVISTFSQGSAVEIQVIKNIFDSVSKWCKKFLVVQALGTDEFDYLNDLYYAFGLQGLSIKVLFVD
jgi:hypothetical protein